MFENILNAILSLPEIVVIGIAIVSIIAYIIVGVKYSINNMR